MHSNFFFRPSFCCFMILFGCLFYSIVRIRYVRLKVHSCFLGYLLMVTNRVVCDLFGNDLTHFVSILKIFPSQPLFFSIFFWWSTFFVTSNASTLCSLALATCSFWLLALSFFAQAFIFWTLLCSVVQESIVFLVGVKKCTSPSSCSCHCHLCPSFHIINSSNRHHQYCYMQ